MDKYKIFTDVTSDLSEDLRKKYDIEYVKGHIKLPDGTEKVTECGWTFCTHDEFYKDLKRNPKGYSTSPASPDEFVEAWTESLENGYDILALSISTALSGTYNFMLQAKKQLLEKYPERKINVINSLRYSTGFGLLAINASIKRAQGLSLDEVTEWVEQNKCRLHQMGFLDDLSFVASKGRISKPKAFMGQLVGVKPLGEFDYQGLTTVIGKAKGDTAAINAIIEYIKKTIEDPEKQIIFIASTNRMKQALELKKRIEEEFKPLEVIINEVYPACGVNVGPGLMAAYYFGSVISEDLSKEKEIITDILSK